MIVLKRLVVAVLSVLALPLAVFAQPVPPPILPPPPSVGVIKGKALDFTTGAGAPSGSYPWTRILLQHLDASGAVVAWYYGDCWATPPQGCAKPDGTFKFKGSFPVGDYQLILNADGHLQQIYWLRYEGGVLDLGQVGMEEKPISVRMDYMGEFPDYDGRIEFAYRVIDQSGDPDPEAFRVHVTVAATGTTDEYVPFPARLQPAGSIRDGRSVSFNDFVDVPAGLPAGAWLCVTIQVSRRDNPLNGLDQTGECRTKGGTSTSSGGKG